MPDHQVEELLRGISAPVTPPASFTRSLLERLERELNGQGLSAEELDQEAGEELPYREAMSLIGVDPLTFDPGLHLGGDPGDSSPPTAN